MIVNPNPARTGQTLPHNSLNCWQNSHSAAPNAVLADAGYRGETCLKELAERRIDGYLSVGREGRSAGKIDAEKSPATARMAEKLESADGKSRYAERKGTVEPVNGWIKHILSFRQFSLRGLQAVRGEWNLV